MFRFTIRDMLWLTVVVALAVSWWIDNRRIDTAVAKLEDDRRKMIADLDLQKAELADKLLIVNDLQLKAKKEWERLAAHPVSGTRVTYPPQSAP